jgi:hypothetical protein
LFDRVTLEKLTEVESCIDTDGHVCQLVIERGCVHEGLFDETLKTKDCKKGKLAVILKGRGGTRHDWFGDSKMCKTGCI